MNQKTQGRASEHFHAVRFYENHESLCRIVGEFLGEGIIKGQPALVIGTPEHCYAIVQELRGRHPDIDTLQASGDLVLLDAREILDTIMVDGHPDSERFTTSFTGVIDRMVCGRKDCTIRAYGEMVDLLWKDGLTVAAVQLEMYWNKLAATRDFSLLCGYAMGNFYKDAAVEDICRQHSHVVSAMGEVGPTAIAPATVN